MSAKLKIDDFAAAANVFHPDAGCPAWVLECSLTSGDSSLLLPLECEYTFFYN